MQIFSVLAHAVLVGDEPIVGGDDVDGEVAEGEVFAFVVGDNPDVRAPERFCGGGGSAKFPRFGFGGLEGVGDLHDGKRGAAVADNEVGFVAWVLIVVDIVAFRAGTAQKFQEDNGFEAPSEVVAGEGVSSVVHEADIDGVDFLAAQTQVTFG